MCLAPIVLTTIGCFALFFYADRIRILKIDRDLTAWVSFRESLELGRFHDQAFKVIPLPVLVARMQHGFRRHGKPSSRWVQAARPTGIKLRVSSLLEEYLNGPKPTFMGNAARAGGQCERNITDVARLLSPLA